MDATGKLYRASLLNQDGNCAYGVFHNLFQKKVSNILLYLLLFVTTIFFFFEKYRSVTVGK